MRSPFPGMDPYLEHPSLWPDVHNSLIVALAHDLAQRIAPRCYTRIQERTHEIELAVPSFNRAIDEVALAPKGTDGFGTTVENVFVDVIDESYLEIHETVTKRVVTVVELLSPGNKLHAKGRAEYEEKRADILSSRTNLIEIDLLRAGRPMPLGGRPIESDYRILVSRAATRPRAHLYPFNLRDAIPVFTLPLLPNDEEPEVELGRILHALYERARYDLSLDYAQPPVPPIHEDDVEWARELIAAS